MLAGVSPFGRLNYDPEKDVMEAFLFHFSHVAEPPGRPKGEDVFPRDVAAAVLP